MDARVLDRYEIVRDIERHGARRSHVARDVIDGRCVIVTLVEASDGSSDAGSRERLRRMAERARAAKGLDVPGIAAVRDVVVTDDRLLVVTEYLEGRRLDEWLSSDDRIAASDAVAMVAGLAESLDRAHRAGWVHGALDPRSIVRTGPAEAVITGFGCPEVEGGVSAAATHPRPEYAAPETVRTRVVDANSDLWALAAILAEMLTGMRAFSGDSEASIVYRVVHEPPEGIESAGLSPALRAAVLRALSKDPQARFATGRAFAEALRRAETAVAPETSRVAPEARPGPVAVGPRSRMGRYAWAVVVVLLVVALAVVIAGRLDPRGGAPREAPVARLDTVVRTEPTGAEVRLDGRPVDEGPVVFPANPPHGRLVASAGCREAVHDLTPADAGRTVVIVLDPTETRVTLDVGQTAAQVTLNGRSTASGAAVLDLDLCRENVIEAQSPGYRPARIAIPAGATPLQARDAVGRIILEKLPEGRLRLPEVSRGTALYVDGRRVAGREREVVLLEGRHEVRAVDGAKWVDVTAVVDVRGGETATASLEMPALARFILQAFPPNARGSMRRRGERTWRALGELPAQISVAPGDYDVRVDFVAAGAGRESRIHLRSGENPPLRVALEGSP